MIKSCLWMNYFSVILISLLLSSCAHHRPPIKPIQAHNKAYTAPIKHVKTGSPYHVAGVWYYPLASGKHYDRTGVASWYGKKFNGRKTANGERYDMYAMTAAHTTLPLPSRVRVTNLSNGRSVVVRINDRGPFVNDRIIDLSYAAAKALGYDKKGTTRVRVQTLDANGQTANTRSQEHQRQRQINGHIYIQLGAFRSFKSANELRRSLIQDYPSVNMIQSQHDHLYRVHLGPFATEWRSKKMQFKLKQDGYVHAIMIVQ
ncbi:MAG: septal ring lytic transglycosylase RlpA family protein [Mariprofundaceae bacterium]|nr:septal ring lytic transglycosylase RlpA family protein [Mariprofundaceae bacterium]